MEHLKMFRVPMSPYTTEVPKLLILLSGNRRPVIKRNPRDGQFVMPYKGNNIVAEMYADSTCDIPTDSNVLLTSEKCRPNLLMSSRW